MAEDLLDAWNHLLKNPVKELKDLPEPFKEMYARIGTDVFDALSFMGGDTQSHLEVIAERLIFALMKIEILEQRLKAPNL